MIEILKLPNLNEHQIDNLKYINPWWNKRLIKLLKKLDLWLKKFNKNPTDFLGEIDYKNLNYTQIFSGVNNFLNFYKQKINQILTNKKAFQKFNKLISDYLQIIGLCWSILTIINYYDELEKQETNSKKKLSIKLGNDKILNLYQRMKKELKKNIPNHDDVFDQIFLNEKIFDSSLFDSQDVFKIIFKFLNKLYKTKNIDEQTYLSTFYILMITSVFIDSFSINYQHFINQLI